MSHALISKVRTLVSADRKRLKVDNLDLDLSYITPNLLAMSFPGSGIESAWRNSINDVCTLLNKKHNGKFMIWNLCERGYDYSKFNNQILDFPFPDHHAPSLNLLFEIVNSLDNWLKANPENIAVVHCKGGKGRTGTIICCYLYYSCYFNTMEESLQHFAVQRSHKHKGVTQPSQQRYINYFKEIVSGNFMIDVISLNLVSIEMAPLTKEQAYSMSIEIFEHEKEANLSFASSPASLQVTAIDESQNKYKLNVVIGKKFIKDVLIRVYKGASGKKSSMKKQLFHLIFNISFIKLNENKIVFGKKDLDHFKKDQKKFDENFYIECIFQNNCSNLPDHSFQIWNIMSLKYQQMKKAKLESAVQLESSGNNECNISNNSINLSSNEEIVNEDDDDSLLSCSSSSSLSGSTSSVNGAEEINSLSITNSESSVSISSVSTTTSSLADLSINCSDSNIGMNVSTSSMNEIASPAPTTTTVTSNSVVTTTNNASSSTSTPTYSTPPTVNNKGSPANYRQSRMVSVDEMKQMILSYEMANETTTTFITTTNNSNNSTPVVVMANNQQKTTPTSVTTSPAQTRLANVHSMPTFSGQWTPKQPLSKRLTIQTSSSHRLGYSDGSISLNSPKDVPTIGHNLTNSTPEIIQTVNQ